VTGGCRSGQTRCWLGPAVHGPERSGDRLRMYCIDWRTTRGQSNRQVHSTVVFVISFTLAYSFLDTKRLMLCWAQVFCKEHDILVHVSQKEYSIHVSIEYRAIVSCGYGFVTILVLCGIWGSYSSGYEECYHLRSNAVLSVESQPTFRRKISHPSSGSKNTQSKMPAWKQVTSRALSETSVDFQQTTWCYNP
jgi:hypothetical protein